MSETHRIISKYLPKINLADINWKRIYATTEDLYYYCSFKFILRYFSGITIPVPDIAIHGTNNHKMFHLYFKVVDAERLVRYANKVALNLDLISKYIYKYFSDIKMPTEERTVVIGFCNMEARRLVALIEKFGTDIDRIIKFYMPVYTELEAKNEKYGGRIDVLFRDPETDGHNVRDWKCGPGKPWRKQIPESVDNQVHFYGLVLDEVEVCDEYDEDNPKRIVPETYTAAFPRFEFTYDGPLKPSKKRRVKMLADVAVENINQHIFDMRCDDKHCKWSKKWRCEWFDIICKKIMENEYEMLFDGMLGEEGYEWWDEIWTDF